MASVAPLVISRANGMHFVKSDSNNPNTENTRSYDEKYANFRIVNYCQRWDDGDTVTVQCVSGTNTVPTVQVHAPGLVDTITATLEASYTDRYYFEFDVVMSSYSAYNYFTIKVTQGSDTWESEKQVSEDLTDDLTDGYLLKLDWTNKDLPSALPNHGIDFTTGIEFFMYAEAIIKDPAYKTEDEVYRNITEMELISSQQYKTRALKTGYVPEFITDKITIASKHFVFMINDLQYVAEDAPSMDHTQSNTHVLTLNITHKNVLGFDSDDKGLEGDVIEYAKVRSNDAISGTWSFVVPAGYIIHAVMAGHGTGSAGDYTIKMGYSAGEDEIITDYMSNVPLSGTKPVPIPVHRQPSFTADDTIYVTLTGAGAVGKIYVNLIWNLGT